MSVGEICRLILILTEVIGSNIREFFFFSCKFIFFIKLIILLCSKAKKSLFAIVKVLQDLNVLLNLVLLFI